MLSGRLVLDIKEAAHALSISPWTVRLYIRNGKLKPVRAGRRVLIEPAELQRLVEQGRKPRVAVGSALRETEIERVCAQGVPAPAK